MKSQDKRLEGLSPERLELLGRLRRLREEAPTPVAPEEPPPAAAPPDRLRLDAPASADDTKRLSREFYNNVSRELNGSAFAEHALFLNYGYVSNGSPERSPIQLPERYLNRNPVKLVLETIGAVDLKGLKVLDVGCGRGGTAWTVNRFFQPARFAGLDLSPEAIAFCRRTHRYPGFSFLEGDAEHLPFADGEFDAVTNIESSHNYPDIVAFYRGVHRVLKPGGRFLYTDNLPLAGIEASLHWLKGLGMSLVRDDDITANVLRSCDETAATHRHAFSAANNGQVLDTFLAVRGSPIYDDMLNGKSSYRVFCWIKND